MALFQGYSAEFSSSSTTWKCRFSCQRPRWAPASNCWLEDRHRCMCETGSVVDPFRFRSQYRGKRRRSGRRLAVRSRRPRDRLSETTRTKRRRPAPERVFFLSARTLSKLFYTLKITSVRVLSLVDLRGSLCCLLAVGIQQEMQCASKQCDDSRRRPPALEPPPCQVASHHQNSPQRPRALVVV